MPDQDDEFTSRLHKEVKEALRRRTGSANPRTPEEAVLDSLEPLIREIGSLRSNVDAAGLSRDKASYDAGVAAERKRCAAIADAEADRWLDDPAIGACRNIAANIRKTTP